MSKDVNIFAKNLTLTEDLQKYVTKKASKLDKYLKTIDDIRVDLSYVKTARESTDRFIAQITLRGKGFILRAEERADEIKTAVDKMMDKIERQIERYKGKKYLKRTENFKESSVIAESVAETAEEGRPLIARRKTFTLVPMDEMEAIEQMNLLGHEDFFIFYNAKTNKINVLYRRRDGTYGLIEPIIA